VIGDLYFYIKSLVDPVFLFLILISVVLWRIRQQRRLPRISAAWKLLLFSGVILYLLSIRPGSFALTRMIEKGCPADVRYLGKINAVVVPGSGVSDGGPWGMGQPTPDTAARLLQGLQVFRESDARYLILAGGRWPGKKFSEAEVMAHIARQLGTPKESLILDERSLSTWEHAVELRKMDPLRTGRVAIVTSSAHMRRMEMVLRPYFKDMVLIPAGCAQSSMRVSPKLLIPTTGNLYSSAKAIYEIAGLIKYRLKV
jgi:uncharacterized SAM-binding protein YcdF (DUF218 family)